MCVEAKRECGGFECVEAERERVCVEAKSV